MPCDRYDMPRRYTHLAFDPPSAHYVGASAISVPFQIYDEEGEIQIGPEGRPRLPLKEPPVADSPYLQALTSRHHIMTAPLSSSSHRAQSHFASLTATTLTRTRSFSAANRSCSSRAAYRAGTAISSPSAQVSTLVKIERVEGM